MKIVTKLDINGSGQGVARRLLETFAVEREEAPQSTEDVRPGISHAVCADTAQKETNAKD